MNNVMTQKNILNERIFTVCADYACAVDALINASTTFVAASVPIGTKTVTVWAGSVFIFFKSLFKR